MSHQFNPIFVLNLDGCFVLFLTNTLFFVIPLIYYYINLRASIIVCLFSGYIYVYIYIPEEKL